MRRRAYRMTRIFVTITDHEKTDPMKSSPRINLPGRVDSRNAKSNGLAPASASRDARAKVTQGNGMTSD